MVVDVGDVEDVDVVSLGVDVEASMLVEGDAVEVLDGALVLLVV